MRARAPWPPKTRQLCPRGPYRGFLIPQHHVRGNTLPDGFGTSSEPILGADIASKSRPQGAPEALPDGYYPEMQKNQVLASVLLVLSTRPRCNLTVKTQVFLKILALSCFSFLHIILSHGDCKKTFKTTPSEGPKPFQKALRIHLRLGTTSVTGLERFWTPKWAPQVGL